MSKLFVWVELTLYYQYFDHHKTKSLTTTYVRRCMSGFSSHNLECYKQRMSGFRTASCLGVYINIYLPHVYFPLLHCYHTHKIKQQIISICRFSSSGSEYSYKYLVSKKVYVILNLKHKQPVHNLQTQVLIFSMQYKFQVNSIASATYGEQTLSPDNKFTSEVAFIFNTSTHKWGCRRHLYMMLLAQASIGTTLSKCIILSV